MEFSQLLFKTYSTDGLILRKLKESDVEDMYEYTRNIETCKYMKWGPYNSRDKVVSFIKKKINDYAVGKDFTWGIELKSDKKLIGVIRIYNFQEKENSVEISYILNSTYGGKGLATLAVRKVSDICFKDLGADKIVAYYINENYKSFNLLMRCGFKKVKFQQPIQIKNKNYILLKCIKNKDII